MVELLLNSILATEETYRSVVDAWGLEALQQAIDLAPRSSVLDPERLWLVRAMASAESGRSWETTPLVTSVLYQRDPSITELMLASLCAWPESAPPENPLALQQMEAMLVLSGRQLEADVSVWNTPMLGSMAHGFLYTAHRKANDLQGALAHARRSLAMAERSIDAGTLQFHQSDVRLKAGEMALNCARLLAELNDADASRAMAILATDYLAQVPEDAAETEDLAVQRKEATELAEIAIAE